MTSLSNVKQAEIIKAFKSTSRYLDDLLNSVIPYFEGMVNRNLPPELQLNKANTSDTEAPFLDLHLSISNAFVSNKLSVSQTCKTFSKFCRRHYDLVSKFNTGLKSLSELEFYGDFAYKFKKIVSPTHFSDHFRKIIIRYKRIGYSMNVIRQTACLVVDPVTVNNFADLLISRRWVGPQT